MLTCDQCGTRMPQLPVRIEIVREAELDDARKAAQSISKGSISKAIGNVVDPTGELKSSVTGVEKELKGARSISPASCSGRGPDSCPRDCCA